MDRRRVVYYDQSRDLESSHPVLQKKDLALKNVRDFKSGGYKLEGTNVTGERLVVMVLQLLSPIQLPQCREEKSS